MRHIRIALGLALAVTVGVLSAQAAQAQGKTLQAEAVDRQGVAYALPLEYNTLCVDGYKYLFVFHPRNDRDFPFSGLTQMFVERDGVTVPARCR